MAGRPVREHVLAALIGGNAERLLATRIGGTR